MKRIGLLLSASVVCCFVVRARSDDPVRLPVHNDFLIKVTPCNYGLITISKVAETQGSPEVKAFAVHAVKDHQADYEKLATLLKNRKISVVSGTESVTKAEIKHLGDLKGSDFDREYLKWVIKEHKSGISLCENQVRVGKDADVSAFAKEILEAGRKHLQKAEELSKTISSK